MKTKSKSFLIFLFVCTFSLQGKKHKEITLEKIRKKYNSQNHSKGIEKASQLQNILSIKEKNLFIKKLYQYLDQKWFLNERINGISAEDAVKHTLIDFLTKQNNEREQLYELETNNINLWVIWLNNYLSHLNFLTLTYFDSISNIHEPNFDKNIESKIIPIGYGLLSEYSETINSELKKSRKYIEKITPNSQEYNMIIDDIQRLEIENYKIRKQMNFCGILKFLFFKTCDEWSKYNGLIKLFNKFVSIQQLIFELQKEQLNPDQVLEQFKIAYLIEETEKIPTEYYNKDRHQWFYDQTAVNIRNQRLNELNECWISKKIHLFESEREIMIQELISLFQEIRNQLICLEYDLLKTIELSKE